MAREVRRLSALTIAAVLALAATVEAKPTIEVSASFDPEDVDLRDKFATDTRSLPGQPSPEDFLVGQFIDAFSRLDMFTFARGSSAGATRLVLRLSSGHGPRRWPNADVELEITLAGDRPIVTPLFRRSHCGSRPCSPASLADAEWYRQTFSRLIKQWPPGLLKNVVLTDKARYERGGRVRTLESVAEFGQRNGGPPTALFELLVGDVQIPIALCLDLPFQGWRGLGKVQGGALSSEDPPTCWPRPVTVDVPARNGTLTLVRAFL